MGKVIVLRFATLDGVIDDPDGSDGTPHGGWAFRHGPEAVAGDKFRLGPLLGTGVELLGRTTWQMFARIFPTREDPFSRKLTAMEKLVASRTLEDVDAFPNSTLLQGDPLAEVRRRREHQDVVVAGSMGIVESLMAQDLVDQYRLVVFPIVLGKGRRMWDGVGAPVDLTLVASEDAGGGALRQVYDRRRA